VVCGEVCGECGADHELGSWAWQVTPLSYPVPAGSKRARLLADTGAKIDLATRTAAAATAAHVHRLLSAAAAAEHGSDILGDAETRAAALLRTHVPMASSSSATGSTALPPAGRKRARSPAAEVSAPAAATSSAPPVDRGLAGTTRSHSPAAALARGLRGGAPATTRLATDLKKTLEYNIAIDVAHSRRKACQAATIDVQRVINPIHQGIVVLKASDLHHIGVFANQPIKRGHPITIFNGLLRPLSDLRGGGGGGGAGVAGEDAGGEAEWSHTIRIPNTDMGLDGRIFAAMFHLGERDRLEDLAHIPPPHHHSTAPHQLAYLT